MPEEDLLQVETSRMLAPERHNLNFDVFRVFNYVCPVDIAVKLYMFREFVCISPLSMFIAIDQYFTELFEPLIAAKRIGNIDCRSAE